MWLCQSAVVVLFTYSAYGDGFCASNIECPMDRVCDQSKCVDPCQLNICGDNYDCKVNNQIPFCSAKAPLCGLQPGCRNGQKKYIVYKEKLNWYAALLNCSLQGMSLATVQNQQDQDNLVNAIKLAFAHNAIWLGGADLHHENDFFWYSTGDRFSYKNFAAGEPNNVESHGVYEDCVAMSLRRGYAWNDVPCDWAEAEFACEYFE